MLAAAAVKSERLAVSGVAAADASSSADQLAPSTTAWRLDSPKVHSSRRCAGAGMARDSSSDRCALATVGPTAVRNRQSCLVGWLPTGILIRSDHKGLRRSRPIWSAKLDCELRRPLSKDSACVKYFFPTQGAHRQQKVQATNST